MGSKSDSVLRSITRGAGLVMIGTFIQLGIAFLAKALMARYLPVQEYGFVSLGILVVNVGATVSLVGLDKGVARFLPRSDDQEWLQTIVSFSYVTSLLASIAVAAVFYQLSGTISELVFGDVAMTPVIRVMTVGIPFWVAVDMGVGVTRGANQTLPRVYARNVVLPLTRFAFVAIVIVLGFGAIGVAGAYVTSYAIASIVITYMVIKRLPVGGFPSRSRVNRNLLMFSLPLTLSAMSSFLFRNVDLVLLGVIRSASEVGIYNVAYPIARLLLTGMGAFGFLFLPAISSLHADGQLAEARRVYQVTSKWLVLLTAPLFAVMVLFPEMTIKVLFGAKYVDGAVALSILALGFFLSNVSGLNLNALTSIGRSRLVMVADVSAMVGNIVLNLLLIPPFGFIGAAIATTVTYLGRDLIGSIALFRLTGIHSITRSMVRPLVATGLITLVIYLPVTTFLRVTLPMLVGLFFLFLVLYGLAILRFGGIESEDVMIFDAIEDHSGVDLGPVRTVINRLMR